MSEHKSVAKAARPQSVPKTSRRKKRYSPLLFPFIIVVVTLIGNTGREFIVIHERSMVLARQNAELAQTLGKANLQLQRLREVKGDLERAASDDPVAKKIVEDFFQKPKSTY